MKKIFIFTFIFILSCSTNKVKNNHGVSSLNNKFNKIVLENSNSNDILNLLGPPSTKSSFDTNIWIYIERKKNNHFFIEFQDPINNKNYKDKIELSDKLNKVLEKMVIKNPNQWIWTHNRWK